MIDIAHIIKDIIKDKGLTQYQAGERMGMSTTTVSHYLSRNDYRLNADIVRIADALGYDVRIQLIDRQTGEIIDCK